MAPTALLDSKAITSNSLMKTPSAIVNKKSVTPESMMAHGFEDLLAKIAKMFESNVVDVDSLKILMESYRSDPEDWKKFINLAENGDRYSRVLVDGGNGKYNLMLLCWPPNVGSTIHNHPDSHCIMRILGGSLSEVRYCWPKNQSDQSSMVIECETKLDLEKQPVAYINDSIGLHRVVNRDCKQPAFSLHLYCPPFKQCRVFNELTGQYRQVDVSIDGAKHAEAYRVKHLHEKLDLSEELSDGESYHDVLIFEKTKSIYFRSFSSPGRT